MEASVSLDLLGSTGVMGNQGQEGSKVKRVKQECLDLLDLKVLQAAQGSQALQVQKAQRGSLVLRDPQDHRGPQEGAPAWVWRIWTVQGQTATGRR